MNEMGVGGVGRSVESIAEELVHRIPRTMVVEMDGETLLDEWTEKEIE